MSLVDDMMEPCVRMVKQDQPDGEGGRITTWAEGENFNAAITVDSSTLAQIAEKQGVTSIYMVTTRRSVALAFPDVIRRSDGSTLRITSQKSETPKSAGLDLAQVRAEAWRLT